MLDARIIINVSNKSYMHSNGTSGHWIVPAAGPGEEFAMLLVYNAREIQDVGNQTVTEHWPSSTSVAEDIIGKHSDATAHGRGCLPGVEKWGILLCEANPDISKELLDAIEEERAYLNTHRAKHRQERDDVSRLMLQICMDPPEIKQVKQELSDKVAQLRAAFMANCRKLVTKAEVMRAKANMRTEDERLVAEGDDYETLGGAAKGAINELHKNACRRLHQERKWCYIPQQLIDCPGCGDPIKENILVCPHCGGSLDEGAEELRALKSKERAQFMYPERYSSPVASKR